MIRNCKTLKISLPDLLLNFFTPSEGLPEKLFYNTAGLFLLIHSVAPSPAFEGGVKKCRSGSTLSKPQHL
jgi:hypothetical protein